MALRNAFEDLATDAKLDMMLVLLAQIADKLPRVDVNDRVVVNTSDQGTVSVALSGSQTLAVVTSLRNLGTVGVPTDALPSQAANAGSLHLYQNIIVS